MVIVGLTITQLCYYFINSKALYKKMLSMASNRNVIPELDTKLRF